MGVTKTVTRQMARDEMGLNKIILIKSGYNPHYDPDDVVHNPDKIRTEDLMSSESEVIFMTYDDAAKRLGIKSDSVRRRAAARKWQKKNRE